MVCSVMKEKNKIKLRDRNTGIISLSIFFKRQGVVIVLLVYFKPVFMVFKP